jgi:hypothetical protein
LVGVTTISCVKQEWCKSRKMKIAFIYALAAICTRIGKSPGECLRTTHDRRELTQSIRERFVSSVAPTSAERLWLTGGRRHRHSANPSCCPRHQRRERRVSYRPYHRLLTPSIEALSEQNRSQNAYERKRYAAKGSAPPDGTRRLGSRILMIVPVSFDSETMIVPRSCRTKIAT